MSEKIVVHKLDEKGKEVWRYSGQLTEKTVTSITLEARYDRKDQDFHGLSLRIGDRFVETFFSDRWYNVFAIYDVESGHLKGWYCNVTRPAKITRDEVAAEDLALDLWVEPDGNIQVLDEDEFARLELPPEEREAALEALGQLRAMVAWEAPPFDSR